MASADGHDLFGYFTDLLSYGWVLFMAFAGYALKRTIGRIDDLEKNKVSIDVFNATIKTFREDLKNHNDNVLTEIRLTRERVDKIVDKR